MSTHPFWSRIPRLGASALMLAAALTLGACDGDDDGRHFTGPDDRVVGSGNVASQSRSVSGFSGVVLSGAGRLVIEQAGVESLTITADDNLLPLLTSEVRGGQLHLGVQEPYTITSSTEILYELTVSELSEITISGAADVEVTRLDTPFLGVTISGAANVRLEGRADVQVVTISGAAGYHAEGCDSQEVAITLSGAGYAVVRASHKLEVTVSGTGVVEYYGNPEVTVSGNGTVRRMGA